MNPHKAQHARHSWQERKPNNMKKIKLYKEIDTKRALELMLASKEGYVTNMAFRDDKEYEWQISNLLAVNPSNSGWTFKADDLETEWYTLCAEVVERFPNETPEDVPELPHPWLVYVGLGKDIPNNKSYNWALGCGKCWCSNVVFRNKRDHNKRDKPNGNIHYAIDVRTKAAKDNFPELVKALGYNEIDGSSLVGKWVRVINTHFSYASIGDVGVVESFDSKIGLLELRLPSTDTPTSYRQWLGPNQVEVVNAPWKAFWKDNGHQLHDLKREYVAAAAYIKGYEDAVKSLGGAL